MELPPKMQFTIVSHYGKKEGQLLDLIRKLQDLIASNLFSAFQAYEINQVHGTLVGLEGCFDWRVHQTAIRNYNYYKICNETRYVDFAALLAFLQADSIAPISIRIGGYKPATRYGFQGRDENAFERSFSAYGQIAVAMGWPLYAKDRGYPLNQLRTSFNKFNVLHKEHKPDTNNHDDAFYFVLGRIDRAFVTKTQIKDLQESLRQIMSQMQPIDFQISKDTMNIVGYLDSQVPLRTSRVFKFDDLSPERLACLYPKCP